MPEDTPIPEDAPTPKADIGIVFVHGIGDHKESETLLTFGEPMTDWLAEWLRPRGGDVVITDARLRANRTESESPAYALAEIRTKESTTTCLMTEAWWGESVRPPDSLKLLGWLFYRGPLLIFAHFCLGRKESPWIFLLRALGAIPLCAVVQLLALVAMILWIIPIDYIRTRIAGAVRILTLTLGDSFVLLEQEFQRAAFVARVRAALRWTASRAGNIVLIAHSQGGAIAHEAIANQTFGKLRQFITVGSGLEKLYFLRAVRRDRRALLPAALAAPLVLGWALAGWESSHHPWLTGFTFTSPLILFFTLIFLDHCIGELRNELVARLTGSNINVPWLDLYATHDLVAAGPRSLLPDSVTRQPVVNRRSLLRDHVTYFERREDSVPKLWSAILAAARQAPWPANPALERLRERHDWHTRALALSFWTTLAATLAALYVFRTRLLDYGQPLQSLIQGLGLDNLNQAAAKLSDFGLPAPPGIWASLTILLFYSLGWQALHSLWELCAAARWRRHCAIEPTDRVWQLAPPVVPLFFIGISTLPLVLVAATHFGFMPATTLNQIGSAFFIGVSALTGIAAITLTCHVGWRHRVGTFDDAASIVLVGPFYCWLLKFATAFFWEAGGFIAIPGAIQVDAVYLTYLIIWTLTSPVVSKPSSRVAVLVPWAVGLAVYLLNLPAPQRPNILKEPFLWWLFHLVGVTWVPFAAVLAALLTQLTMIFLSPKPNPAESQPEPDTPPATPPPPAPESTP